MKMASILVSIFDVNGEFIQEQAFMVINHDAFATGFEERMCTALNLVRGYL